MKASVDIGSNTVRMLVGDTVANQVSPFSYFRSVTRLAGGYNPHQGISPEAAERTFCTLESFAQSLQECTITGVRVVATEAVRRARNSQHFVAEVLRRTGFHVEIIAGEEEAALTSLGVLAALDPAPESALIFDIGGGSTEFIVCKAGQRVWQKSFPLGVITLAESATPEELIRRTFSSLQEDLFAAGFPRSFFDHHCELIGTAGTVTTLAAIDLEMAEYDWQRVNNHTLSHSTLLTLYDRLLPLTPVERENIRGIEKGRGDLILPGLQVVLFLLRLFNKEQVKVSDFGLLEGILLAMD